MSRAHGRITPSSRSNGFRPDQRGVVDAIYQFLLCSGTELDTPPLSDEPRQSASIKDALRLERSVSTAPRTAGKPGLVEISRFRVGST